MVQDDHLVYFNNDNQYYEADFNDFSSLWKIPEKSMYIPVTFSVWYVVLKITGGENPALLFHLLNLVIHLINGILLFFILKRLIKIEFLAFLGALFFLIHPLQIEAWAYISGLRGLLAAFFALIIINIHLTKKDVKWTLIKLLLFALAMLSKPTIIVLPLILVSYDLIFCHKKLKTLLIIYAPFIIIAAYPLLILLRPADSELYTVPNSPIWIRPFFLFDSINFYLFKVIWPWELAASYARTPNYLISKWWFYLGWIIPAIISYVLIRNLKKKRVFLISWFWIIIAILPISGLMSFVYQNWSNVADRYFYLSFAGLTLMLTALLSKLKNKKTFNYLVILVLALGIYSSREQLPVWRNDFTLWKHCAEITPREEKAFLNLGNEYMKLEKMEAAINAYNRALGLQPEYVEAILRRAIAKREMSDYVGSLKDFNEVALLSPQDPRIFFNRAFSYIGINVDVRAIQDFSRAITLKPEYVSAYNNRGSLYAKQGDSKKALLDFTKTLELDPEYLEAYNNIGNLEAKRQNFNLAILNFTKALEINPEYVDALNNRALANYLSGNFEKAKFDLDYLLSKGISINQRLYNDLLKKMESS